MILSHGILKQMSIKITEKALEQLNDREKQIMELRFGLVGGEEKPKKMLPTCLVFLSPIFQGSKKNY